MEEIRQSVCVKNRFYNLQYSMFYDMEEIRRSCAERRVLQSTVGCVVFIPLERRDSTVYVRKEEILQSTVCCVYPLRKKRFDSLCEQRRDSTLCCVYPLRYGRDSTVCVCKEEVLQFVVFTSVDMEEIRQSVCVKKRFYSLLCLPP